MRFSLPPSGENGYESVFYLFWPPGYSKTGDTALVRALVGPTCHGASITCQLEQAKGSWLVVKHWFSVFA